MTRSNTYQYIFREVFLTDEHWTNLVSSSSLSSQLNPFAYSEECNNLEDELKARVWHLAKTSLTDRQWSILHLLTEGWTQQEIADHLAVNQSSVNKCINGNDCLMASGKTKRYGGMLKKLRSVVTADEKTQELLTKIRDLRENLEIK